MIRVLLGVVSTIVVLSFSPVSFGAETIKLRHAASVYSDARGNGLRLAEGVACSQNVFVVADTGNGRLLKYSFDSGAVKGGDEIKIDQISYPLRVQIGSKGEIFALDGKQRRIIRLGPDGAFKGYVDPSGIPSGAVVARSFKLDSADNIYILDIFSERVLMLDPSGKYIRHVDFPQKGKFFSDLAVDFKGAIFLLDGVASTVYSAAKDAKAFTPLSQGLEEFVNFPASITLDRRGNIYLADQNGSGIVVLGQDGSFLGRSIAFGWRDGLLRYPGQLCASEKEAFFVADRENNRVQIFTIVQ